VVKDKMTNRESLLAQELEKHLDNGGSGRIRYRVFAEKMSVSEETVSKWMRSKAYPYDREHLFIDRLGWSIDFLKKCRFDYRDNFSHKARRKANWQSSGYRVKSFKEYFDSGNSVTSLGDVVEEILDLYPLPKIDGDGNDMGGAENWNRIYAMSPETGYVLLDNAKKVQGFWFVVAVNENCYKKIIEGENVNKNIGVDDVEIIKSKQDYDLYFVDLFLHPDHNKPTTRAFLFEISF
jgi:hypothetical protein